jgi:hypothetical protein
MVAHGNVTVGCSSLALPASTFSYLVWPAPEAANLPEKLRRTRLLILKLSRGVALSSSATIPKLGRPDIEAFFTSCANELA